MNAVDDYRKDESKPRPLPPAHTLITQYRYNTLGQVSAQSTPDAGVSHFWYDRLGRLVLSQNAKQMSAGKFSYTEYDGLGRIAEVGEKVITQTVDQTLTQHEANLAIALSGNRSDITHTVYDEDWSPFCPGLLCAENLRNRVSFTYTSADSDNPDIWDAATFYSYDIHGNVHTLIQDYKAGAMNLANNRFKKMEYKYDLISGKVNEVAYQPGQADAFYHQYSYDAENKLVEVFTSRDKIYWETEASYKYYKHGPLSRVVLGDNQVQGIDYAYTIQGWLKGVNSTATHEDFDMGRDGKTTSPNALVARDAFGFSLNYFASDYKPINATANSTAKPFINTGTVNLTNSDPVIPNPLNNHVAGELFNGNIASMFVNIPQLGNANLYAYKYDQLNRIKSMDVFNGFNNALNSWSGTGGVLTDDYKERIAYDANGNILSYLRNGSLAGPASQTMDNLTYDYYANSNKLKHVADAVTSTNYSEDIDDQADLQNYEYDAIGNLIIDKAEGITGAGIEWNVYGKIKSIHKGATTINYTYDASGNRISKRVNEVTTWYVRDASGNVMSVYEKGGSNFGGDLTQTENHLYGSSRLGVYNVKTNVENLLVSTGITTFERGNKFFELTNHLGNVLVTVSDKKIQHNGGNGMIDYYTADVVTANDYYPGGMIMPERKFSSLFSSYRYGFNGKEKSDEVYGDGNIYDYGFRIYNPRLGRFLSVDPIACEFPWWTPYQFAGNTPINTIDLDGLEVPSEKNKNKTEHIVFPGSIDFSAAKVKRKDYKSYSELTNGDPFDNIKTFGINSTIAGWNQIVDFAETGVNVSTHGGLNKIWNEKIISTGKFLFVDWPNLTTAQQLKYLKEITSDPETYENLIATLTMAVIMEKYFPEIKLPIPKQFEPFKKEIKTIINEPKDITVSIPVHTEQSFTTARTYLRKTSGGTKIYETSGGFNQANMDFNSRNLSNVQTIKTKYGAGRMGTLPNGNTVIVRPGSSDGRPTLEIQGGKGRKIEETRYN